MNPLTGDYGFSPELIEMENVLEELYGQKREYKEQYREAGYGQVGNLEQEIEELNLTIGEEQLLDPRMFGGTQ